MDFALRVVVFNRKHRLTETPTSPPMFYSTGELWNAWLPRDFHSF